MNLISNQSEILYKYRSTQNLKFVIDIILNNRLFAAKYDTLNDPMEGHYIYRGGELDRETRDLIYSRKGEMKVCSLSRKSDNFLMWSHYADGHKGIALGVKIDSAKYKIRDIDYIQKLPKVRNFNDYTAEDILSSKLDFWNYEEEVRVFTQGSKFIDIEVAELIVGGKMPDQEYGFIRKLVNKINPEILIRKNQL